MQKKMIKGIKQYFHILGNPNIDKKNSRKDAIIYGFLEQMSPLKNDIKNKKDFAEMIPISLKRLELSFLRLQKEKYIKINKSEISVLPFSTLHKKYCLGECKRIQKISQECNMEWKELDSQIIILEKELMKSKSEPKE